VTLFSLKLLQYIDLTFFYFNRNKLAVVSNPWAPEPHATLLNILSGSESV